MASDFGKRGVRYDEKCGERRCQNADEVCNDCGRCETHCSCAQDAEDRSFIEGFDKAYPGKMEQIAKHHEQGVAEH